MSSRRLAVSFAVWAALLAGAGGGRRSAEASPPPMLHAMSDMNDPADTAMRAAMEKMQRDMATGSMTGNPDRDFVAMMLPHHLGAVEMAQIELRYGKDAQLRGLAKDIVAAQQREILLMKEWQAKHPAP